MGFVKPRMTGEAEGTLAGASTLAVMMRSPNANFQPSRAGFAVVEAEKKQKSAEEVEKMLANLRSRPHRTMDVDKLLDKLKRQRVEKEKSQRAANTRRESVDLSRNDASSFSPAAETEEDGGTATDARSLWKKAVQGGGGNEIYKAISNVNAFSEVQLPIGESNTLGVDPELLNGLAHNNVRSVNLTCAEPPLGDNSITVLAYAVMKSTSVVTLNIGVGLEGVGGVSCGKTVAVGGRGGLDGGKWSSLEPASVPRHHWSLS